MSYTAVDHVCGVLLRPFVRPPAVELFEGAHLTEDIDCIYQLQAHQAPRHHTMVCLYHCRDPNVKISAVNGIDGEDTRTVPSVCTSLALWTRG